MTTASYKMPKSSCKNCGPRPTRHCMFHHPKMVVKRHSNAINKIVCPFYKQDPLRCEKYFTSVRDFKMHIKRGPHHVSEHENKSINIVLSTDNCKYFFVCQFAPWMLITYTLFLVLPNGRFRDDSSDSDSSNATLDIFSHRRRCCSRKSSSESSNSDPAPISSARPTASQNLSLSLVSSDSELSATPRSTSNSPSDQSDELSEWDECDYSIQLPMYIPLEFSLQLQVQLPIELECTPDVDSFFLPSPPASPNKTNEKQHHFTSLLTQQHITSITSQLK